MRKGGEVNEKNTCFCVSFFCCVALNVRKPLFPIKGFILSKHVKLQNNDTFNDTDPRSCHTRPPVLQLPVVGYVDHHP